MITFVEDLDIAQLAMQFAISNTSIGTTLVGTSKPQNIIINTHCAEQTSNAELMAKVLDIFKEDGNNIWSFGRSEYDEDLSHLAGNRASL
ncbi:hypothetical protein DBZ36_10690 [Alginatibacterium sediminis]|uniref:NADP-dependent oxidoreductase domain-containing protein n=1 Tax=Alginatibacterium sediminis TaxID=2164068 RepID=A0A420EDS2_9ALTE|nr:hypothetical protein [Alginatibacterium sediminis]RKF18847.1 hypothetical protein DBZ36_10690 [Alginatibacterium sediminis]